MGNMSYCRFENTASALQDCLDAVEELMDHNGKDSHGEPLSTTEKDAFEEMIELAETYFNWAQGIQEKVDDAWTEEQESFK